MQDILKNFLSAGEAKMPVTECGDMDQGGVTLKTSSAGEMADILRALAGVGGGDKPAMPPMPPMDTKMITTVPNDDPDEPGRDDVEGDDDIESGMIGSIAGGALGTMAGGALGGPVGAAVGGAAGSAIGDKLTGEEYDNEPEEEYMDVDDVLPSGDDLHRKKPMSAMRVKDPAVATESIKDRLWAALNEKKSK